LVGAGVVVIGGPDLDVDRVVGVFVGPGGVMEPEVVVDEERAAGDGEGGGEAAHAQHEADDGDYGEGADHYRLP
jgi:hypothetical protein